MFTFFKNTFLKGLLIMIPVAILYITLRELLELMIGLAAPIADLFPHGTFREDDATEVIAAILILLTAFALGLLWTWPLTRAGLTWLETNTLNRVPMYRMFKSLVAAFLDMEGEESFKPALLVSDSDEMEPVYVIESHGEDHVVVMLPWSPTPFAGSVKIVKRDRVRLVSATLDEYSMSLTHFGLGLSRTVQGASADDPSQNQGEPVAK